MSSSTHVKQVLVHLGPHKTGSTAIQRCLAENTEALRKADVAFLHNEDTHKAAIALANEAFEEAEHRLSDLSKAISRSSAKQIIISQEDFSGGLVGRSNKRQVYGKLTKNLRIIWRSLRPHQVKFVFFLRDEREWLRSCYHQHLKYRTRFHQFADFQAHYGEQFSWAEKTAKAREVFGDGFVTAEYSSHPTAGLKLIVEQIGALDALKSMKSTQKRVNSSPSARQVQELERVNALSEFKATAWFAKSLILDESSRPMSAPNRSEPAWPPRLSRNKPCALPLLRDRVVDRVPRQGVDDILPSPTVDLDQLAYQLLPEAATLPASSRSDIRSQSRILEYHLRGKSWLSHLNALTISYLRRDTPCTAKAAGLFHRIWNEQGVILINELSTRWLISTLQTFLDHGVNEAQRSIGTAGYFYGNLMKIYEGERAIEGLEADAVHENTEPSTPNKFRGLDRFNVGGTDLMLNTNALLLEIALRDPAAGLVLQELLLRVKASSTVFSRLDRTRKQHGIQVANFEDTWSFFEPPKS